MGLAALAGLVVATTFVSGAAAATTGNLLINSQANEGLNGWAQCSAGLAGVRTYAQSNTPNNPAHPGVDEPWLFSGYRAGSAFNRQSNKCLRQDVDLRPHSAITGHGHPRFLIRVDAGSAGAQRDGAFMTICVTTSNGYFQCHGTQWGRFPGQNSNNTMTSTTATSALVPHTNDCEPGPVFVACGAAQTLHVFLDFVNFDPPGPPGPGNNTGAIDHVEVALTNDIP